MPKNVLIIKTSPRKAGNSDKLADSFAQGAVEAEHRVETISLIDKTISFCQGCFVCQKTQKCVIADDAVAIADKVLRADVVVWATPVYYYCCSGQMKTLIDRLNPLYTSNYKFRDVYLLATAAEDEPTTFEGTEKSAQGWVDCFENATLKGVVFAGGVNEKGEIVGHKALKEAFEMGKQI
ncbi:MAG TPA: flavodoxin family protein [Paludibacteraceae bacterium]|mgnify:CR=1 FL=1|jgi:multimeric flavodoxin WrbA|nr:flavodoxin family protein [Paludibacteraceae bacterium]HOU67904.1 flavodoxin family protein [Paludibacteraceae bacterium]HPH63567.1 flavodoxin family protein [Paludibacteraceae bacterium]HQF49822.1 flavodoxin family protein [Paludibacteraceae bacterium]HQJ89600.1 flavodoxin family protein [Paludibacteraceae bacterium]